MYPYLGEALSVRTRSPRLSITTLAVLEQLDPNRLGQRQTVEPSRHAAHCAQGHRNLPVSNFGT